MNRMNTILDNEYGDKTYDKENYNIAEEVTCNESYDFTVYERVKRILDILLSLVVAIPIFIVIVLVGIIVKFDSKGPVLFKQERAGKYGKSFTIYKIRTMKHAPADTTRDLVWTEKNDCRITRVGNVLRKIRLDELPQILNVIKGDMSLVGPRPETVKLTEKFDETIADFKKRLEVLPGITGLAQVNGGYDLSAEEKLKFDLKYIENFSLKTDISILIKTVSVILKRDGAQ